jgi:periplasmic divalent cation tolerance protein
MVSCMATVQDEPIIVFSTAPPDIAEVIAGHLVTAGLVACVNISEVWSYYIWEGEKCKDLEHMMVIKTLQSKLDLVVERIRQLHTYEIPEIIAIPVVGGYGKYLEWVSNTVL